MSDSGRKWHLLADIGGTNVRIAIEDVEHRILKHVSSYVVAHYNSFLSVLDEFSKDLSRLAQWNPNPSKACLAVAAIPENSIIRFTNSSWSLSRDEISLKLGGIAVEVINDYEGAARAITYLSSQDWRRIGSCDAEFGGFNQAILGPGTGLGVAGIVKHDGGNKFISGEGGHVDFAPTNDQELLIFKYLQNKFGRVSVERLLSGAGIKNIYAALSFQESQNRAMLNEIEIGRLAYSGDSRFCLNVMNIFFSILGSVAGNLALTFGAKGGVNIGGGIVPRYLSLLENSPFRSRFEDKGRYQAYLKAIPTRVITRPNVGLLGASDKLRES